MTKSFLELFEELGAPYNIPPSFLRWTAISIVSGLAQRKIMFSSGGKGLYLNLFCLLVGEPGSGKSASLDLGLTVLDEVSNQIEVMSSGLAFNYKMTQMTPAAMIARLTRSKQILPGFTGSGQIVQSPLYVYVPEAGSYLKDIGGGDAIQELLHLFDCPNFFNKETRSFGTEFVESPYITLLLGTTPDYFEKFFNSEATGQGLSARFIFAHVDAEEETKYNYNAKIDLNVFREVVNAAKRIALCKGVMMDHPDCAELTERMSETFNNIRKESSTATYYKHYFARKFLMVRKVAALLSLCESSSLLIERRHYELANGYLSELEPKFAKLFKLKNIDMNNIDSEMISALRQLKRATMDDILRYFLQQGKVTLCPKEKLIERLKLGEDCSVVGNIEEIDGETYFYAPRP